MRRPARLDGRLILGSTVAVPADDHALSRVTACVREAADYFHRTSRERSAERLAAERLADALADASRRLFVIEDHDEKPIGLLDLALDTPDPKEATIALLVLSQRKRGLGLGREIAESLFGVLAAAGFERVRLGVAPGECDAANFWTAVGMWPSGEEGGVRLFERPL